VFAQRFLLSNTLQSNPAALKTALKGMSERTFCKKIDVFIYLKSIAYVFILDFLNYFRKKTKDSQGWADTFS
tara:strand:- start:143 stop:358 length:216 start_codon:yes stop_codon:yes gene_type:complete